MADPVTIGTLAAMALSLAAQEILKGTVGAAVKDAYAALKDKVERWAGDDVEALEKAPTSKGRQTVIAEHVDQQPKSEQEAVQALATQLMQTLEKEGANAPAINVRADRGGIAAGRDISGNTITTDGSKP